MGDNLLARAEIKKNTNGAPGRGAPLACIYLWRTEGWCAISIVPPTSAEPSPSIPFPSPLPRPRPRPRSPSPLLSRRRRPAAPPPSTPARSAATSARAAPIDHAAARVLLLSRDPAIEGLARSSSPPLPPLFDSIVPSRDAAGSLMMLVP